MPTRLITYIRKSSLETKIFLSSMAVIISLSIVIALLARWVLVSSLTEELKDRGLGIARSIARDSQPHLKTGNTPALTELLVDARGGHRKSFVAYFFLLDQTGKLLAHTFSDPFPDELASVNPLAKEKPHGIVLFQHDQMWVYDIAVPVKDGYHLAATVHVGINKQHIDKLIAKLRNAFIGFISIITILFFWISHGLSKQITRPISELVKVADEISRGNLDVRPNIGRGSYCWDIHECDRTQCPAFDNTETPCWYVDGTLCESGAEGRFPEKLDNCRTCEVHQRCAGDEVIQLAHSITNMTMRLKYSEADLRASEEQYRTLFDSGPNPIFVLSQEDRRILDANPMALETYGYSEEELVGMDFSNLGPFEFVDGEQVGGVSIPAGTCVVTEKTRHFKKGKTPFFVRIKACAAHYKDMEVVILAATDITELIEKDVQLMQASKMTTLGEMAAGVAHELSQPLNAIQMGSDYLKMRIEKNLPIDTEELQIVSEQLSSQVRRGSDIINNMREFGRKPDHDNEPMVINDPIRSVLKIIGKQLELQNISISLDLDAALCPTLAQKNKLEQVFLNLISNARDAIIQPDAVNDKEWAGKITIRTFQKAEHVVATVTDTGAGIPEDIIDRVFEPFFTTKEVGKGMGLGLSITYGIVQEFNGTIEVTSEEGAGTTFTLYLPIAKQVLG